MRSLKIAQLALARLQPLFWVLLVLCMLLLTVKAQASPIPSEQNFSDLETLITNTSELSTTEAGLATAELQTARKHLIDLQKRRAEVQSYLEQTAEYQQDSSTLESNTGALLVAPEATTEPLDPNAPVTEPALNAKSAELESIVRRLSQELFEARDTEAYLSERSKAIAQELAQATKRRDQSRSLSQGSSTTWQQSITPEVASVAAQVKNLTELVQAHVATETANLLQLELSTLAPRQTLASIKGRMIQIRLERTQKALDRQWTKLTRFRSTEARSELKRLVESTQDDPTDKTEEIELLQAQMALLDQELPILRQTQSIGNSILEINRIRLLLSRVSNTGTVSDSLADMIRTLREELPDANTLNSKLQTLQKQQRALQVNKILWEGKLWDTRAVNPFIIDRKTTSDRSFSENTLVQQVALLNTANRLADEMVTLQAALIEAQTHASDVRSTLDGSVLWLRTNESAGLQWVKYSYSALQWALSPDNLNDMNSAIRLAVKDKALTLFMLAVCLVLLIGIRPQLKRTLVQTAAEAGNVGKDRYGTTPLAIMCSFLLALPAPLILISLYGLLDGIFAVAGSMLPAVSNALFLTSGVLFLCQFFKTLSRPDGVFHRHFGWSSRSITRLNHRLRRFVWIYALCTAAYTFAIESGRSDLRYTLGIVAFLLASSSMSILLYIILHPDRGVALELKVSKLNSPFSKFGAWLVILLPTLVGLLPLVGYFDTAVEIQQRAFGQMSLLIGCIILIGLIVREFMVAYRRMALRKIRAKRAAMEAERNANGLAPISGDATPDLSTNWDDDYKRVTEDAQKMLRLVGVIIFLFGTWALWKPMFPALDNFNEIVMWQGSTSADGAAVTEPVTLGKLLFAFSVVLMGVVSSRNLRGVLELLIFERLKLDIGTRYAINAITSYVLVGTTLLIAISQMGVDWSKLQWIVAALGVGLGFGLQEIVANFISGLIILFERPIRVGDTVTIGGVSGTISNIQIRATTLTDFDNLDVILPNKTIITEDVTNWTLNDSVTRILLKIRVAYGSDIIKVRDILDTCITDNKDILDDPEPTVFFMNHGSSSLDFELRVFVPTPAHRLPVTHDLNSMINERLTQNGIVIPFPQQVVHLAADPKAAP